ncbi:MAG: hypothetical protein HY731_02880 [Candidatus Tectomicrobia bacterium]|nr:hypothetical protein [Candidatus Tectomicrobia bacterium]
MMWKGTQCWLWRLPALCKQIYDLVESWRSALAKEAGFTYMELVTTISVIGIASAIAVPTFTLSTSRVRLNEACRELASNLQLARLRAISTGLSAYLDFDHNNNQRTDERFYTAFLNIYRDSPAVHDVPAETEAIQILMPDRLDGIGGIFLPRGVRFGTSENVRSGPEGVALPNTGVSSVNGFKVRFAPRGDASTASIYLTNGSDDCAIQVTSTGRSKVYKWISDQWQ